MTGGILLALAGVWLGAQVIGGDLTGRLGITTPNLKTGTSAPGSTAATPSASASAAALNAAPSTSSAATSPTAASNANWQTGVQST